MSDVLPPESHEFTVPGTPRGQGRPRFHRVGKGVRTYKLPEDASYEELIAWHYKESAGEMFEGPIKLYVEAHFERPKSHHRKNGALSAIGRRKPHHTQKPDLDNIIKALKDALSGIAYKDDVQIVEIEAKKDWTYSIPRLDVWLVAL